MIIIKFCSVTYPRALVRSELVLAVGLERRQREYLELLLRSNDDSVGLCGVGQWRYSPLNLQTNSAHKLYCNCL